MSSRRAEESQGYLRFVAHVSVGTFTSHVALDGILFVLRKVFTWIPIRGVGWETPLPWARPFSVAGKKK